MALLQSQCAVCNVCRWFGRAAIILGIVNFFIGVDLHYDGDQTPKALHLYIAAIVILATFLIIAILKDAYNYITEPHPDQPAFLRKLGKQPAPSEAAYADYADPEILSSNGHGMPANDADIGNANGPKGARGQHEA